MDNGRTKVMLPFDVSDLPMLVHALAVARNTALMSGNRIAMKRLEQHRAMIDEMVPEAARVFDDQIWSEICLTLYESESWSVGISRPEWSREGWIEVQIGEHSWKSRDPDFRRDHESFAKVTELLQELAPIDAVAAEPAPAP